MTKRVLSLILCTALFVSVFFVSIDTVKAAEETKLFVEQDYEGSNTALTEARNSIGTFQTAKAGNNTYGVLKANSTGMFHSMLLARGGGLKINDWAIELDLRCQVPGAAIAFEYYDTELANNMENQSPYKNLIYIDPSSFEQGIWYRYRITCDGNNQVGSTVKAFRKNLGAAGSVWEDVSDDVLSSSNFKAADSGGFMVRTEEKKYLPAYENSLGNTEWWIDNIKLFSGVYVTGDKIETVENKLQGTVEVLSADADPVVPQEVLTLMAVYDSKGKIIDMKWGNAVLNDFMKELILTSNKTHSELSGNTVEMYLWDSFDSMEPLKKIYSMVIQ